MDLFHHHAVSAISLEEWPERLLAVCRAALEGGGFDEIEVDEPFCRLRARARDGWLIAGSIELCLVVAAPGVTTIEVRGRSTFDPLAWLLPSS